MEDQKLKDYMFIKIPVYIDWNKFGEKTEVEKQIILKKFELSLKVMRDGIEQLYQKDIACNQIAMPLIGCGIDGLEWTKIRELIHKTFDDMNIEIVVCYLEKDKEKLQWI